MFELITRENQHNYEIEFVKDNEVFFSIQLTDYKHGSSLMFDQKKYSLKDNSGFFGASRLNIQDISEPEKFWMRIKYPGWGSIMQFRLGDMLEYDLKMPTGFFKEKWVIEQRDLLIAELTFRNWNFTPKNIITVNVEPDFPWLKMILGSCWFVAHSIRLARR